MKSKHLFFTMAFAAAFTACTNEELVENVTLQDQEFKRPVVENVAIEAAVGDVETRLSYGLKGYSWDNGDELSALLMDEKLPEIGSATFPREWDDYSWNEKYGLVDYVHTNFQFVFDKANGEWKATGDLNMLEGNYFLVSPYCKFNGNRQAYYEIATQTQVGNTLEGRAAAYTSNQIFVGYGRLQAGQDGANIMKTEMAEILSPIRINIESDCKQDVVVKKIVLRHPSFATQLTIDPTSAWYGEWNLANSEEFNYANYLQAAGLEITEKELYYQNMWGSESLEDYVYNAGVPGDVKAEWDLRMNDYDEKKNRSFEKYYWDDAIRTIVKPLWKFNDSDNRTGYIEVYTKDSDKSEGMVLANEKLGIIAMIPTFTYGIYDEEPIMLEIHTNFGVVRDIDLSRNDNPETTVQTVGTILAAHPNMPLKSKTVTVIIDNEDIERVANDMEINTEDDLANMVAWAAAYKTNATVTAYLQNDITINDELAAKIKELKDSVNCTLAIEGTRQNCVKLKTVAEADVLEYIDIIGEYTIVEVQDSAVVKLTENSHNFMHGADNIMPLSIRVNKGGTFDIEDNNKSVEGWGVQNGTFNEYYDVTIYNEGTVNAKAQNIAGIFLVNEGVMNVTGSINLAKHDNDLSVNTVKGQINVAVGATLTGTTSNNVLNYGVIENKGRIYNIANLDIDRINTSATTFIPGNIKPGQVIVADGNAVTQLETNEGKVTYAILTGSNNVILRDNNGSKGIFEYLYDGTGNLNESTLKKAYVTDLTVTKNASISDDTTGESNLRHIVATNGVTIKKAGNGDGKLIFASYDFGGEKNTMNLTGSTNAVVIDGVSFENCPTIVIAGKSTWKGTFDFGTTVELNAVKGEVANGANVTAVRLTVTDNKSSWIENHGTINVSSYDEQRIQVSHNPI